ncbi:MAG TPA: beta-ketoacyl synthase N-terminal-like domain-containing protein [Polyangiales bacterium]
MTESSTNRQPALLLEQLERHAAERAAAVAFTYLRDESGTHSSITFGQLQRRARALAQELARRGLAGQPVLLLYPAGIEYVCGLLACWYAGATAVPAYPASRATLSRAAARLLGIAQDAGARVALTTSELSAPESSTLELLTSDTLELATAESWQAPAADPTATCLLQYTSGSTSTPKGVAISHQQVAANQAMIQAATETCAADVIMTWLPPYHDMGLMGGILQPLYVGARCIIMPPDAFIRRPLRWLKTMQALDVSVSMAPNFAFDLCVRRIPAAQREGLDLSALRLVCTGAEPINPETLDRFTEAFAPHGFRRSAFYPCYGMAEATLMISGGTAGAPPIVRDFCAAQLLGQRAVLASDDSNPRRRLVSCGRSLPGEQIVIADSESCTALPEGQVGEIWVRSPSVASGYFQNPEQTELTFHARLHGSDAGPFLRTGDLGFLLDGELFVAGRLKDLIIIRGRNHHPHDLERSVQSIDAALLAGCGAAFSIEVERAEQLVVVQEVDHRLRPDADALLSRIAETLRQEHELAATSIVLIKKGSLPKTSSGKLQRKATANALHAGTLEVVARLDASAQGARAPTQTQTRPIPRAATAPAIARFLRDRLARRAKLAPEDLDDHAPLARYGVDSLAAVELTEELEQWLGHELPSTISYDNPTIAGLARALATLGDPPALRAAHTQEPARPQRPDDDGVVIVGMGCRFPGANDLRAFWSLLRHGIDAISEVPKERWDAEALSARAGSSPVTLGSHFGGFVENIDGFDPAFFGLSLHEAARMDPQQRLFLEVVWEALEDAAIAPPRLSGSDTGVFVGACSNDYALLYAGALALIDADYGTGNARAVIANRVSYLLDLKGPSLSFDTACSSALVALQAARDSLLRGESTLAIVGGVNAVLAPEPGVFFANARALAADGRCKTFDAKADGFVRSEGCGVVVLKRMSRAVADGDRIYAEVLAAAVNHSGTSNGLMAPSGPAQERLLRRALSEAQLTAQDLDYVEAHGVGAPLADLVELRALGAVMRERSPHNPCLVGSVKTNLGHLEAASGMASVIKTALALTHQEIPPHLHLYDVHPDIAIDRAPLSIPTVATPWPRGARARRAGVSAFGFGGTNAHVILGEPPAAPAPQQQLDRPLHVLALSARDPQALRQLVVRHARAAAHEPLGDVTFTANTGRAHFKYRAAFVAGTSAELRGELARFADRPRPQSVALGQLRLAMIFGQSPVHAGCATQLHATEPVFHSALATAEQLLAGQSLSALAPMLWTPDAAEFNALPEAQLDVVRLSLQYALVALLESWGVTPAVVLGQGIGELGAACTAGLLSWSDALVLAAQRARLLPSLQPGATIGLTVQEYKAQLQRVQHHPTRIPFVAGSLGRAFEPGEAVDPAHWLQHLYHTHHPEDGFAALSRQQPTLCLEIGAALHQATPDARSEPKADWLCMLGEPEREYAALLQAVAQLYVHGVDIDWQAFDAPYTRNKLALPTYPFQRKRCWLSFPTRVTQAAPSPSAAATATRSSHPLLQRRISSAAPASGFVRKAPQDSTG